MQGARRSRAPPGKFAFLLFEFSVPRDESLAPENLSRPSTPHGSRGTRKISGLPTFQILRSPAFGFSLHCRLLISHIRALRLFSQPRGLRGNVPQTPFAHALTAGQFHVAAG